MKKLLCIIIALTVCILPLCVSAFASLPSSPVVPRFVDSADVVDDNLEADIIDLLDRKSAEYGMDYVITFVNSTGNKSIDEFADDYFDYNGFGENGICLVVAMSERDYYISTCGEAISVFDTVSLGNFITPFLSLGDYASACKELITAAELQLSEFPDNGEVPYDYDGYWDFPEEDYYFISGERESSAKIYIEIGVISLIIGFIISCIMVSSMKRKHKTVAANNRAGDYYVSGSMVLNVRDDAFMYKNVNRVPIPKEEPKSNGHSGGGGSVHVSSSGRSHGGSGGKF